MLVVSDDTPARIDLPCLDAVPIEHLGEQRAGKDFSKRDDRILKELAFRRRPLESVQQLAKLIFSTLYEIAKPPCFGFIKEFFCYC